MSLLPSSNSSTFADPLSGLMQAANVMFLGAALFGDILIIRCCLGVAFVLYVFMSIPKGV